MSNISPILTTYVSRFDAITRYEGEHTMFYAYSEMNAEKARTAKRCGQVYITRGIYGRSQLVKVNDVDISLECITYYVERV